MDTFIIIIQIIIIVTIYFQFIKKCLFNKLFMNNLLYLPHMMSFSLTLALWLSDQPRLVVRYLIQSMCEFESDISSLCFSVSPLWPM